MNLAHLVVDVATERADSSALLFEGEEITYGELEHRAAAAAGALHERGVRAGDRVALRLPNTPAYVAAYLGALRLGAIAVPLNILLARPEVDARIRAAAPTVVVDRELHADGPPHPTIVDRDDDAPAALLFTSGTTGRPKGAILTHGGIRAAASFAAEALAFTRTDVILGVSPFPHVLGQQVLLSSFSVGAGVCIMQRFEPESALATMTEARTTVMIGVPTMCITLSQAARGADELPPLRIAHIGGAAVPVDVTRRFEETFGADIHEGYGLTEMSGLASTFAVGRRRKPGSVGRPSGDTEVRIVHADEQGIGEIQFRGPSVITGYWNDSDSTASTIDPDGWLSTGDLGHLDEDGDLFIVDRKKELIIRGGYNVYPREVEEALYEHPAVLEAAVVGVPHETLGEDVAAFVVVRPGATVAPDELQSWAKERVAAYKYPRHVLFVGELPKGPTGKILKREIGLTAIEGAKARESGAD